MLSPLPLLWVQDSSPGSPMSWSGSSAPLRGPVAEFPSQPDHFLLASQPEHDREGPDLRQGLIGAWPESPRPISLPTETFPTETATQTRITRIGTQCLASGSVPEAAREQSPFSLHSKVDYGRFTRVPVRVRSVCAKVWELKEDR